jgi:glutathione synthase/RimK-type ligase-like ATP-grasp enzyme
VRATRLEFGGVDILERDGSSYLLESNFPCYYPHAQQIAGIDVAGAMVDHLLRKAGAFTQTIDPAAV